MIPTFSIAAYRIAVTRINTRKAAIAQTSLQTDLGSKAFEEGLPSQGLDLGCAFILLQCWTPRRPACCNLSSKMVYEGGAMGVGGLM